MWSHSKASTLQLGQQERARISLSSSSAQSNVMSLALGRKGGYGSKRARLQSSIPIAPSVLYTPLLITAVLGVHFVTTHIVEQPVRCQPHFEIKRSLLLGQVHVFIGVYA
jgi:hypothetical protein